MKPALRFVLSVQLIVSAIVLSGCTSGGVSQGIQQVKMETAARIQAEAPGDYWIGRRYYKPIYKFWGYVRRPGQPWSTSKLVMMNEKQKLAPDRAQNALGSDNNYEYKLYGDFSGETVYEPASNGFYPEFVLKNYELVSTSPPPILKSQYEMGTAAGGLIIEKPQ